MVLGRLLWLRAQVSEFAVDHDLKLRIQIFIRSPAPCFSGAKDLNFNFQDDGLMFFQIHS